MRIPVPAKAFLLLVALFPVGACDMTHSTEPEEECVAFMGGACSEDWFPTED